MNAFVSSLYYLSQLLHEIRRSDGPHHALDSMHPFPEVWIDKEGATSTTVSLQPSSLS